MKDKDDSTPCLVIFLLITRPETWFFWVLFGWRIAMVAWIILLIIEYQNDGA